MVKYFCGSHSDKWILEGIIDSKKVIYYILKVTCATEQLEKSFSWRESFQMLRVNLQTLPPSTSAAWWWDRCFRQTGTRRADIMLTKLFCLFIYLFVLGLFFFLADAPAQTGHARSGQVPDLRTTPDPHQAPLTMNVSKVQPARLFFLTLFHGTTSPKWEEQQVNKNCTRFYWNWTSASENSAFK